MSSGAGAGTGALRTSFGVSFFLLPPPRREAIRIIYRFCRLTDDLVDNERDASVNREALGRWRTELAQALGGRRGPAGEPSGIGNEAPGTTGGSLDALARVAADYRIDPKHFFDLIEGVGMDLEKRRYQTFGELERYCLLVASSVGMMCLPVFGADTEAAAAYARRLGIALQLTNIIRDVAADAAAGRIYLPLEDLRMHGCAEAEILGATDSETVRRLIRYEVERAEELHAEAAALLPPALARELAPARVMAAAYRRILAQIRRRGYTISGPRVRLSRVRSALTAARYLLIPPGADA